jgi:putative glutamine amidotransferase
MKSDNIRVGITWPFAINQTCKKLNLPITLIKKAEEAKEFDLIIFPGGEDINPGVYGRDNRYSVGINEERDQAEIDIYRFLERKSNKKMLGICRGHQLINALIGANMCQDIYFESKTIHGGEHELFKLSKSAFNEFSVVNSMHHQAVYESTLKATAIYKLCQGIKIVEVCEHPRIITVQFHPEFLYGKDVDIFWENIKSWVKGDSYKTLENTKENSDKEPHYQDWFRDASTTFSTQARIERDNDD